MRTLRRRRALLGAACARPDGRESRPRSSSSSARDSRAEPTQAQYLARVAAICRVYGPRLDRIRPPDVAEPANVIDAVTRALPLVRAQERRVRGTRAARRSCARRLARWFDLQDRRLGMLETALRAARRQDFRALERRLRRLHPRGVGDGASRERDRHPPPTVLGAAGCAGRESTTLTAGTPRLYTRPIPGSCATQSFSSWHRRCLPSPGATAR